MRQMPTGYYGRRVVQDLRLKAEPPSLVTPSICGAEIAVTDVCDDDPEPGGLASMPLDDAFIVSLQCRHYPDCELWERGKFVAKVDVRPGMTFIFDMKHEPGFLIDKPHRSLGFYLPRSALDALTEQSRTPRVGQFNSQFGTGHDDAVMRSIGVTIHGALRQPEEANQLFVDHMMLAVTAHIAQAYGGLRFDGLARGGLAAWQVSRACEKLQSDLRGELSLQQIAAEFGLSTSHFSRAFRVSVGLPPHQWLLRQRINAAKQLMTIRDLPLAEIAISAGFANQSHFTRVFSSLVGVSPRMWRREVKGAPESYPR